MLPNVRSASRGATLRGELTERELEALGLMTRGLDNQEIRNALFLSEGAVKNHVTSIYGKLGVRSRPKAIAWAREQGIGRSRVTEGDAGADRG